MGRETAAKRTASMDTVLARQLMMSFLGGSTPRFGDEDISSCRAGQVI